MAGATKGHETYGQELVARAEETAKEMAERDAKADADAAKLKKVTVKMEATADEARRSSAEHLIATKALRCTATAWILIVAQCSATP